MKTKTLTLLILSGLTAGTAHAQSTFKTCTYDQIIDMKQRAKEINLSKESEFNTQYGSFESIKVTGCNVYEQHTIAIKDLNTIAQATGQEAIDLTKLAERYVVHLKNHHTDLNMSTAFWFHSKDKGEFLFAIDYDHKGNLLSVETK
ncbi:hypothetical protein [Vibrio barjaei]|uniref:hypothetical protein n=1 Tax=Vibrio barjaei TaxID=1676683 RepID=UPI002283B6E9|nr:hypothetical protein [Vibrio barjaei]MCY9874792.1 hypothetical protein [Vibrio barjaei]